MYQYMTDSHIDTYIMDNYDILHTQSKDDVVNDIIWILKEKKVINI